ncbi:MBL fold metallo-hydrolase [Sphaerisporangium rufum]|uniref:MBL fold metallo-hydrolase n=1 Tax=Sphaerisporangium rufum TaxID=1381558 RepID=A0A919R811_9ACTN|nr:MBL fold metallo-hydrolase [Sphaerisporangium rufum]GII79900.1 MBL fold metallo-hydrolase [Sphaerisporangium rufum]
MARWVEVAERVFVRRHATLDLSLGLVVGERACLVVDTGADEEQGAEFAAAVRELTGLPWSVLLTHAHFDHCFGTAAFGGCPVWGHPGCRAELAGGGARADGMEYHRSAGDAAAAGRLADARAVPPDRVVPDRAEIDLGGRRVLLWHPGPGHTGHDLVAHVPDAGVVFAGDLVEQGAPPAFEDSFPERWPDAVGEILAAGPRIVVPGHGDPVDAAFVAGQRAELAAVAELCRAVRAGEITEAEAVARSPYPAAFTGHALARAAASR